MKNIRYSRFKTKQQINLPTPAILPKKKRSSPPTPHPPPPIKRCLRLADELIGCITIVIVDIFSDLAASKKHYTAHYQCEVYSVFPKTYFHAGKLPVEARRDLKCTHQVHRKRIYELAQICSLPTNHPSHSSHPSHPGQFKHPSQCSHVSNPKNPSHLCHPTPLSHLKNQCHSSHQS